LRIIHLEADSNHAALVASTLNANGFDADIVVVCTRFAFRAVFSKGVFGVVLSAYNLSAFDWPSEKTSKLTNCQKAPILKKAGEVEYVLCHKELRIYGGTPCSSSI